MTRAGKFHEELLAELTRGILPWWSADGNGTLNRTDDKAGPWKCPYHNGRMCMGIIELMEQSVI